jgi:GH24 family phage-related lysozyme (muramidase)
VSTEGDRRIKELEAQLKEQELRDKKSASPLFAQSFLAALPIILTIGLGFLANYVQSRGQHQEQLTVLEKQGQLEREKQGLVAQAAERTRVAQANQTFALQDREAKAQRERQEREFAANAVAAASQFAQAQLTLRQQHSAQQGQQAREFNQSLERQRREAEVEVILKAGEVPTSLSPEQQDVQRARNLLWYAQAGYIRLPAELEAQLHKVGRVPEGQGVALPVTQSSGGTAGIDLAARFEGFAPKARSYDVIDDEGRYIGYGHGLTEEERRTNRVRIGDQLADISDGISEAQGRALLRQDMQPYYGVVDSLVKVPLTPFQRDALAVFVRNIGKGNFAATTLLRRLNAGDYDSVPEEMMKWIKGAGQVLPGLRRQREAEIELWRRAE